MVRYIYLALCAIFISRPAMCKPFEYVATVITSTVSDGLTSGDDVLSQTPYQQLMDSKLYRTEKYTNIVIGLNRTSLGNLLYGMIYHDPAELTKAEGVEYCEDIVKSAWNGSLAKTDEGGCDFSLHCTFDPLRFPAIMVNGEECANSYCNYPDIKRCIKHDVRVPILIYQQTPSYKLIFNDHANNDASGKWIESREWLITDCMCEM